MKNKTRHTIHQAAAQSIDAVLTLMRGPHSYSPQLLKRQGLFSTKLAPEYKQRLLEAVAIMEAKPGQKPDYDRSFFLIGNRLKNKDPHDDALEQIARNASGQVRRDLLKIPAQFHPRVWIKLRRKCLKAITEK